MKTKEGFELKKLKTFPSMEYGENGGISCDIYLKGKKVISYFDEGNGGEAIIKYKNDANKISIEELAFITNNRLDTEASKEFPEAILRTCIIDSLVENLIGKLEDEKQYKKYNKRGYKYMVMAIYHNFRKFYAASRNDIKEELVNSMCDCHKIDKNGLKVSYFTSLNDFNQI